jgi:rhodanese-related sulfurtransferase
VTDDASRIVALAVTQLKALFDAGGPLVLLDVRESVERAHCAIRTSAKTVDLHFPMGEIPTRLVELRARTSGLPVVVYCHHGVRSMAVAQWLATRGFERLNNLEGGIDAWSLQVDPAVPRY